MERKRIVASMYYFPHRSIDLILDKIRELFETRSFLTMGNYCREFEEKYASYVGSKYAASVSSGTAALEIIFRALNVKGFDVIVPTNTFAATVFAILRAGGRPIFADCCEDLTVDPDDVKRRLTNKTRVVVTVHIGGLISPHVYELIDLCESKGIYLVEDAAHAHGSMLDGNKSGTFGVAGAFSFFASKVITTGEGGMITTNDEEIYRKALLLRNQAKVDNRNYHEEIGYNWRMTEIQALLGIEQIKYIESFIKERTRIAQIYDEEFERAPTLKTLQFPKRVRHNYYKYVVFTPRLPNRELVYQKLKNEYGVSLSGCVYELPCHVQPVFKEYSQGNLSVSEDLCNRHICPPIYVTMKNEEAVYVANSIIKCLSGGLI